MLIEFHHTNLSLSMLNRNHNKITSR